MSLEAWGDENPHDADYESWADRACAAGWFDPKDHSLGAICILLERERQETVEGWTAEHDDQHDKGEIAKAASCYAAAAAVPERLRREIDAGLTRPEELWPWDWSWWKPKNRRADLVRAGALIAAEIDRLDRIAAREKDTPETASR